METKKQKGLKGQCQDFRLLVFFNESVSPKHMSVIDTGGAPWLANISANFRKKFEMTLMLNSGAWGKVIHEKNPEAKNISWHCPFKAKEREWGMG
jgi:hypothetical protein